MTNLGTLQGGKGSAAYGINNSGQVVGTAYGNTFTLAFRYSDGAMTNLGALPGCPYSEAYGINDSGQVVGISCILPTGSAPVRPFLYTGGTMINLGTFPGGEHGTSNAYGINNSGQVVGLSYTSTAARAFLYSGGLINLGALPGAGGAGSQAYGINNSAQVVGYSYSSSGYRAFLYSEGAMTNLGALPGATFSEAYGINDSGQVVGWSNGSSGEHAFLYSGGKMTDLNSLIPPGSGWVLIQARSINNSGQIVGYGSFNGQTRAFLLTPEPEPLVFVPGAAASVLDRVDNPVGNIWFGSHCGNAPVIGCRWGELTLDPNRPQAAISATDVVRSALGTDIYGPFLDWLQTQGYREHPNNGRPPNLFVFPYDWRKSNFQNAALLRQFIQSIRNLPEYQNSKVNLLAHSMGGVLSRRYILDNPGNHHVKKLITVGTPWLGAPKLINVLETGDFLGKGPLGRPATFKQLVEFFPSTHQLGPSPAYFKAGGRPLSVNGVEFTYDQYFFWLNQRYPRSLPGTTNLYFHAQPGQDDFTNDTTGVDYYHIFAKQPTNKTIEQLRIKRSFLV